MDKPLPIQIEKKSHKEKTTKYQFPSKSFLLSKKPFSFFYLRIYYLILYYGELIFSSKKVFTDNKFNAKITKVIK